MKHVLTGGPCSGKTRTLRELAKRGYPVINEAAMMIKEEQKSRDHPVLPETHPAEFQLLVDARQEYMEKKWYDGWATFLDRSRIDQPGYCIAYKIKLPLEIELGIKSVSYGSIFLLETLPPDQYRTEGYRPENRQESLRIAECIEQGYRKCGYRPIRIPFATPEERAEMILNYTRGAT